MMARLRMVQIALLVSRGCVLVRSQQVFHLLDGQDLNKIFDVCSLLKLVRCGARTFSTSDIGQENSSARFFTIPCHFAGWRGNAAVSSGRFVIGASTGRLMPCRKDQTFYRVYCQPHRSLTEDSRHIKGCVNPSEKCPRSPKVEM